MSTGDQVHSTGIFCSAWANVFYQLWQVFKNGAEEFTSQHAQPMGGCVKNHSTCPPQCIIDYTETKHAKLSAHQQA